MRDIGRENMSLQSLQEKETLPSNQFCISWEEPEQFEGQPREYFDISCLPHVVKNICEAIADSLTVSADMVGTCALTILSTACQNHIVEIKSGWEEPLNLFGLIVASAGEKKSPVQAILKKPFDDWQSQKNSSLKSEIEVSKQTYKNLKKKLAKAESDILKSVDGAEEEAIRLAQELADFEAVRPVRLYSGDCTTEKLAQLLAENNEQFSIISSEGGIVSTIAGRYSNGEANSDIYCKAFYGESVQVDRVNRDSDLLDRPILSMLLAVQPVVLKSLINNSVLTGVGLVDRFLFCVPPSSIGKSTFNSPAIPDKVMTEYHNLVTQLLDERQGRKYLKFSHEARKLFADFYDHFQQISIPRDFEGIEGWASKHCGIVARIAGILQLSEDGNCTISADNVLKAITLSDYFQEQARLVLGGAVLNEAEQLAEYVLERIKKCKSNVLEKDGVHVLKFRDLQRTIHKRGLKTREDFAEPLQILCNKGYIDVQEDTDVKNLRELYVNPVVLEG